MLIYSEAITKEQQDKDSTSYIKFLYVGIIMWGFFSIKTRRVEVLFLGSISLGRNNRYKPSLGM